MATKNPELDNFLSKVDEIENVLKGLNSTDVEEQKTACGNADSLIKEIEKDKKLLEEKARRKNVSVDNTGVNRSLINQKAFDEMGEQVPNMGPNIQPNMDQNAMFCAIEADAKERAARRKIKHKEATVLKDKGNEFFKTGDYEKAIDMYSEGLSKLRDYPALYTNRAQAYICIGEYEKALEDCDWAIRCNERCLKAYIHQGRAQLKLKRYDEALESYEKALKMDPSKQRAIQDYKSEVEQARETEKQEAATEKLFQGGDPSTRNLADVMKKIYQEDQLPVYYGGGISFAQMMLINNHDRTLFRQNDGLQLTHKHPVIRRCFSSKLRSLSKDERELMVAVLNVFVQACTDNDENKKQLFEVEGFASQLQELMGLEVKLGQAIRLAGARLLHVVSASETGRVTLAKRFDVPRLLESLFKLIEGESGKKTAISAASTVNNLATERRFLGAFCRSLETVLFPALQLLTENHQNNLPVLPSCVNTLSNLCQDVYTRKQISNSPHVWELLSVIMVSYKDQINSEPEKNLIFAALGLLNNATIDSNKIDIDVESYLLRIGPACMCLCSCNHGDIVQRSLGVLSRLSTMSSAVNNKLVTEGIVAVLVEAMKTKDSDYDKEIVRCLAAVTKGNEKAQQDVVLHKGLTVLVRCLDHQDEQVFGNASLILGNLTSTEPKVIERLTRTDIIKHLLVLARDGRRPEVQKNCSILIAKLAQGDTRHLEKLRELHGVEILLDVMKHMK